MTRDPQENGYLGQVPPLPTELLGKLDGRRRELTDSEERELDRALGTCKQQLRQAREHWEKSHGSVSIEPPFGCESALAMSLSLEG